ncbi:hypothetical protein BJX68DRAFT_269025 [Aspergillus pseudodeflectus]|uniref:2EXR domain-containing protein n=1 Tax=Aspergillus pseudodeflectus TaxID=176178 RepID=A0ABR4K0G2_9EURO
MKRFPQFPRFPAELRRQIWHESSPLPGLHAFDVCIPSTSETSRLAQAFQTSAVSKRATETPRRVQKYSATVFLDQFLPTPEDKRNDAEGSQRLDADPSAYHITSAVRQTCFEALEALRTRSSSHPKNTTTTTPYPTTPDRTANPKATNRVYLAAHDKWITYDNANDVLFLRFGGPVRIPAALLDEEEGSGQEEEQAYPRTFRSGISDVLLCPWSEEFTETLRHARRVALDLAELRTAAGISDVEGEGEGGAEAVAQDIAYLACCLQNGLEVLYVIVDGVGGGERGDIASLQTMGKARNSLSSPGFEKRDPDVFYGKGVTYHEVFALEGIGLGDGTSELRGLRMLGDAVREQQGEDGVFRGIRVLVCQRDRSECNL